MAFVPMPDRRGEFYPGGTSEFYPGPPVLPAVPRLPAPAAPRLRRLPARRRRAALLTLAQYGHTFPRGY
jgi:hypothetical protein